MTGQKVILTIPIVHIVLYMMSYDCRRLLILVSESLVISQVHCRLWHLLMCQEAYPHWAVGN